MYEKKTSLLFLFIYFFSFVKTTILLELHMRAHVSYNAKQVHHLELDNAEENPREYGDLYEPLKVIVHTKCPYILLM